MDRRKTYEFCRGSVDERRTNTTLFYRPVSLLLVDHGGASNRLAFPRYEVFIFSDKAKNGLHRGEEAKRNQF